VITNSAVSDGIHRKMLYRAHLLPSDQYGHVFLERIKAFKEKPSGFQKMGLSLL
jgi:hypothetical protein